MKKLITVFAFLVACVASADQASITLSKTYASGADARLSTYLQCNLIVKGDAPGMQVIRRVENTQTVQFTTLVFSGVDQIEAWAESAKKGEMESVPGYPGADTLSYTLVDRTDSRTDSVDLMVSGNTQIFNKSNDVKYLVQLLDLHCPKLQ